MFKKVITIRVPLAVLYAVLGIALVAALLWMTNAIPNLRLVTIRPSQIESITVFHHVPHRQTTLNPEDTQALAQALPKVMLEGRSVRLMDAEFSTPQFRVQLRNGQVFDFSCFSDHYILNGRAYNAKSTKQIYQKIYELYQSTNNRSYFPPAEQD